MLTTVKTVPLQAWSGPEGSSKLRFRDFMTTAQDGGKVVANDCTAIFGLSDSDVNNNEQCLSLLTEQD